MDVRYINPVIETMINVLSTMANLTPTVGIPSLKSDEQALGDVSSVMLMRSDKMNASIAISISKSMIVDIVKRMLGEEINDIDDTARDITGEMTNMVVGGAKNLYEQNGLNFDMSSPSILSGQDHLIHHECNGKTIVMPLNSDSGKLFIELCFEG